MNRFVIQGGNPLKGTIPPSGNKNEALPVLAATLLTDQEIVLRNIPLIGDVLAVLEILKDMGVEVQKIGEREFSIQAEKMVKTQPSRDICSQIRGSFLLAGPLLSRLGQVKLPRPGGDKIGRRRVDTHILALKALGVKIEVDDSYLMKAPKGLKGTDIFLDEASVTATENTLMAAVLAEGTTVISNAASEPHVQGLCRFLNSLGAKISGIGSNILTIEGVERLSGGVHEISSDHIEIGSFIGLAAVTQSELLIKNVLPKNLRIILLTFKRLGIEVEIRGEDLFIPSNQELRVVSDIGEAIPEIDDAPWPGFPADLISIALVVATQSQGTTLIHEKLFESRLFFVDKLIAMGAKIILCDPHRAVVVGPSKLHGEELVSPDIRAGMALVIAALCAEGQSIIHNIRQIDRGYERIDERLRALGAKIRRV